MSWPKGGVSVSCQETKKGKGGKGRRREERRRRGRKRSEKRNDEKNHPPIPKFFELASNNGFFFTFVVFEAPNGAAAGFFADPGLAFGWSLRRVSYMHMADMAISEL
jgi:hypothetical protein